jgi:hypothetical protein
VFRLWTFPTLCICNPCDLWDARLLGDVCSVNTVCLYCRSPCISHPTSLSRDYCWTRGIQQVDAIATDGSNLLSCYTDGEKEQHSASEEEDNEQVENKRFTGVCGSATLLDRIYTATAARGGNNKNVHHDGSDFVFNQPAGVGNYAVTIGTERDTELLLQQQLEQHVTKLTGKVALLQEQLCAMARANKNKMRDALRATKNNTGTSHTSNESFKYEVTEAINDVLGRHTSWGTKRTGALVAQAVWARGGSVPELLKFARKHFRDHVFTTYNVLKEMDLAGGTLSYKGIDVFRRVEDRRTETFPWFDDPVEIRNQTNDWYC